MPKQLLAKSRKHGELTLKQHLIDTEDAAQAIFKGRILQNWCRFFRVGDTEKFLTHLRVAALFHDIGKANAEFYAAVTGSQERQALRHEWFSALILHLPSVRAWLAPSGLDLEVITAAVLCHHLQAHPKEWGKPRTQMKQGDSIELYLNYQDCPEVADILQRITKVDGIKGVNGLPELPEEWVAEARFWKKVYQDANDTGEDFSLDIQDDHERRSLLLAVKAGVIAADSAASGIFRTEGSSAIQQWIDKTLHRAAITPEEIEAEILQRRYRQIEEKSGKSFELKTFQKKAQEQGDRVLLLSGCGTGKTLFAYKWDQAVVSRHSVGRSNY